MLIVHARVLDSFSIEQKWQVIWITIPFGGDLIPNGSFKCHIIHPQSLRKWVMGLDVSQGPLPQSHNYITCSLKIHYVLKSLSLKSQSLLRLKKSQSQCACRQQRPHILTQGTF